MIAVNSERTIAPDSAEGKHNGRYKIKYIEAAHYDLIGRKYRIWSRAVLELIEKYPRMSIFSDSYKNRWEARIKPFRELLWGWEVD